jgi:predicted enzyme related to lactoylglutathione lyase
MAQHGSFYWNELMTADPAAAASFFVALTGCRIDTMAMPEGDYRVMMLGDKPAGGIMTLAPGMPEGWFSYMAVDDVDAACAKVEELGGKIHKQPFEVAGVGRIAIVADPTGSPLGLIRPAGG